MCDSFLNRYTCKVKIESPKSDSDSAVILLLWLMFNIAVFARNHDFDLSDTISEK